MAIPFFGACERRATSHQHRIERRRNRKSHEPRVVVKKTERRYSETHQRYRDTRCETYQRFGVYTVPVFVFAAAPVEVIHVQPAAVAR